MGPEHPIFTAGGGHPTGPYVPNNCVAVAVDNLNRSVQTEGKVFKTAVRNGLVPLKVVYGNEVYGVGATVWVEAGQTRSPWADADHQYNLPDGPKFALCPHEVVRLVT